MVVHLDAFLIFIQPYENLRLKTAINSFQFGSMLLTDIAEVSENEQYVVANEL